MSSRRAEIRRAREESRERIVAAATELVRHTPFVALTVEDVMREAGLGRTIFYRHFDDLGDLLRQAGSAAFEDLFELERRLSRAEAGNGAEVARAAIEPAVAVYARHGPLLRAIGEATATDPDIAAGQEAMRRRFDGLVAEGLLAMSHFDGADREEVLELARALNHLNVSYLLDAFGREPRVPEETAVRTLTRIWAAVLDAPRG